MEIEELIKKLNAYDQLLSVRDSETTRNCIKVLWIAKGGQ